VATALSRYSHYNIVGMEVWTEVVTADIADVHVGSRHVLVPLDDNVSAGRVRQVKDMIAARDAMREQTRQLRETVERQRRVDERLRAAGYEPSEVFGP
jgi:hypothetical protein